MMMSKKTAKKRVGIREAGKVVVKGGGKGGEEKSVVAINHPRSDRHRVYLRIVSDACFCVVPALSGTSLSRSIFVSLASANRAFSHTRGPKMIYFTMIDGSSSSSN